MFIAPAEVQDQKLRRRLRGYNRASVEKLLQEVVASYQQVWRERDQLQNRVDQLEKELAPLREAEDRLRDVLVTAERTASEVRAQAAVDADALLEQAKAKTQAEEKAASGVRAQAQVDAKALLEQAKAKTQAQEKAASEVRAQAQVDADALLEQAKAKSKASQSTMKAQQAKLKNEVERLQHVEQELHEKLRSFLRSGLQLVEDRGTTEPTPVTAVPPTLQSSSERTTQASPGTHKTPA